MVVVYHLTWCINSVAHTWGTKAFKHPHEARNNTALGIIAFGEGWHNNHHHYPNSVNQGFYWWEIDITYWVLKILSWLGIVWDLKKVPENILRSSLISNKPKRK